MRGRANDPFIVPTVLKGPTDLARWSIRLRQEREKHGWTQIHVADQIGVGQKSVSRWEHEKRKPTPYEQQQLGKLFNLSLEELGFVDPKREDTEQERLHRALHEQEQPFPPVWNVPFQIPLFVGREDTLQRLRDALLNGKTTALTQAISGLGGIGKTLTAAKYAYRYRSEYEAVIWIEADSRERLTEGFVTMARELDLPEKRLKNLDQIIVAVRQWMRDHARQGHQVLRKDDGQVAGSHGGLQTWACSLAENCARCRTARTRASSSSTLKGLVR